MNINVLRTAALVVGAWVVFSVYAFPMARIVISLGLLVYAVLLQRFSYAWLIVLPALLPVLDMTPWSGRIVFTEFDFFILTTFAIACWNGRISFVSLRRPVMKWGILALFVSQFVSCIIGFIALQDNGDGLFYVYHDAANVIRASKGFWEMLLFLPLLDYENNTQKHWGEYLNLGMIGALSFFILTIFWERMAFPGLFDVKTDYRITGLFSSMLLGGAIVDGFLVLAFPFFVVCFRSNENKMLYPLGVCLFLGGLYCVLVTYTRSTYLAFVVIMAVLLFGYRALQFISLKRWLRDGVLVIIGIGLVFPILNGEFMQRRISTVSADFEHRLNHWRHALELMQGSFPNYLFGMGSGSFPKYFFQSSDAESSFYLKRDSENVSFLRLSKSNQDGSLYMRQRFAMERGGNYRVSARVRTTEPRVERLLIEICERNILPFLHECPTVELVIEPTQGKWVYYSNIIDLSSYTNTLVSQLRPVEVSIMNRGFHQQVDIAEINVVSPDDKQLLKNNDFSGGFDFWVFSSGNHLAWHIKNQALSIFFESGLFGLVIFCALVLLLFQQSYRMVLINSSYGVVFLACLLGMGVVGFFDSPFDDSRVLWLFYLLAGAIAIGPKYDADGVSFNVPWKRLFILIGMLFSTSIFVAAIYLMRSYNTNLKELLFKGQKQISKQSPLLESWLKPPPKFLNISFDGQVRAGHPRIVLPQLQTWQGKEIHPFIVDRLNQYSAKQIAFLSPCNSSSLLSLVSCRLLNNEVSVESFRQKMMDFSIVDQRGSDEVSNAWELALAYDLIYPLLNSMERNAIEFKIAKGLQYTLDILDEDGMSMWHRRASHAAVAWLCAIVLNEKNNQEMQLLRTRAQGHFLNAMDALAFTEVWPEGYNYWINERGFLFSLAASAYLNGLDNAQQNERIKQIMRQVGYWHIYATRPDNRIEGFGDEGPRVDLKDETRRVIDLIAQMTKDPVLAGYSAYLAKLYGVESYYRDYRWGFLLFNDPSLVVAGDGRLESLSPYLGKAKLFGANSVNYAYLRSDWERNATLITYKAGHNFSHHGHYDAGHFTLFKGAPLIVNSSAYGGDIFSPNRLNYAIRTVAKNSLLIQRPGEQVKPNHFFKDNVSDGGQRLTMPTGGAILSVEDWYQNYHANKHYEAAELLNYFDAKNFTFISSDLTPAYNNQEFDTEGHKGKVVSVLRNLVYLKGEDRLIVYDAVESTDKDYRHKFLLHTIQKPQAEGLRILKGNSDNGILESDLDIIKVANGDGYLVLTGLYPVDGLIRLVGGKDYKYYVETDGDDSILDGKNYDQGAQEKPWFDNAQWRMEIQSKNPALENDFLVAFSPSVGKYRQVELRRLNVQSNNAIGLETDKSAILFSRTENAKKIGLNLSGRKERILLFGFDVYRNVTVELNGKIVSCYQDNFSKAIEITCQNEIDGEVMIKLD